MKTVVAVQIVICVSPGADICSGFTSHCDVRNPAYRHSTHWQLARCDRPVEEAAEFF